LDGKIVKCLSQTLAAQQCDHIQSSDCFEFGYT
jgi:hypothetical protein